MQRRFKKANRNQILLLLPSIDLTTPHKFYWTEVDPIGKTNFHLETVRWRHE